MVKLSIIIPYYDTYELTCELLEELRKQFTEEIEIFVIDDSNEKKLDQFNDIAKIFHFNKRQGLSKARNIGIDNSRGKYIAFIDSDDMISNDYVSVLLKAIDTIDKDIIVFNWGDKNTGAISYHPENYAVWKAIYKKTIVPRFKEELWYNEDVPFQEEINKNNYSKAYINNILYYYNSGRIGSNIWERDQLRREEMIKCEVVERFTLARFSDLKDIKRRSIDKEGELFIGDTFYCDKELAEYLSGKNDKKKVVVKIIEVEPKEDQESKKENTKQKKKK